MGSTSPCAAVLPSEPFSPPAGDPPIYRFWKDAFKTEDQPVPSSVTAQMVETTAYALLTALLRGDENYAKPIIKWLSEEQRHGGGFYSTQVGSDILSSFCTYQNLKHFFPSLEIQGQIGWS